MNEDFFRVQIGRLRTRFGDRAFDAEFVHLVAREVCTMSETGFARTCDVFIGSRPTNKPPLLSEFREARIREEKVRFDNEVRGAAQAMNWPAKGGLQRFLAKEYPGAKTLNEAVEIKRLRNQIEKADNDDKEPA